MSENMAGNLSNSEKRRLYLQDLREMGANGPVDPDVCIKKMGVLMEAMKSLSETEPEILPSAEICLDLQVTCEAGKSIRAHCLPEGKSVFNEPEFEEKIKSTFMKDGILDLAEIGRLGRPMLRPVPGYLSLMGHVSVDAKDLPPKPKKPRQVRPKDVIVEAKKPEKLTQAPNKTEEGVDEIIIKVTKALKHAYRENGKVPVSYFEFVVHPTDFAKTVQNMFHVSFLMKDGHAEMGVNEEGILTLIPCSQEKKDRSNTLPKKQMISSLSVKEWRELVNTFEIKKPML